MHGVLTAITITFQATFNFVNLVDNILSEAQNRPGLLSELKSNIEMGLSLN